jgi:peptidoglycan/xylan/chitin deacetylase (PgdA/CDA1 family)
MVFEVLIGPKGSIPILIRDDDTNFFTFPKMLESIYAGAWSKGFKVCLSIVPFQKGIDDDSVPPDVRKSGKYYQFAENRDLVDYLQGKISAGQIEVLQHGLSHEYSNGIRGEYGGELDKGKDTEQGKDMLKNALGLEPKFFVPPGEDISKKNLTRLTEARLIPIYRKSLFDSYIRSKHFPKFAKNIAMNSYRRRYIRRNKQGDIVPGLGLLKPVILHLEDNSITWSIPTVIALKRDFSIDSPLDLVKQTMETSIEKRSPVCIMNHYHTFFYDWSSNITRTDLYNVWQRIIEYLNSLGYGWKVTHSELFERMSKINGLRVTKTGSKVTIATALNIENLSIRTNQLAASNISVTKDEEDPSIKTIEQLVPQKNAVFYV